MTSRRGHDDVVTVWRILLGIELCVLMAVALGVLFGLAVSEALLTLLAQV